MGPGAVAPQKSLIARADLHQRRGFSLLKDRLFAWVFLKDIADIAHRCALIRKLYGRVQRASRAILVIVPHLHDVVSRSIQVCKITVLAIDHAARRDTAIRVYDYRSVEIKARTRLGRLPKLLLLVGALDSPFKTLRVPAIGDFLAFKEFKRHAHGDEPQMINPQFFREQLSLFYLVLVLLHHDKLPLHNRKFFSALFAPTQEFREIFNHLFVTPANTVLAIGLLADAIERDDQIFQSTVQQLVDIGRTGLDEVRTQIRSHVVLLGVLDHGVDLFIEKRFPPVVHVSFEQIIGEEIKILLKVIEREHGLGSSQLIEAGGTQGALQVAVVARINNEQIGMAPDLNAPFLPLIFGKREIVPLARIAMMHDRPKMATATRVLRNLFQELLCQSHD